MKNPSSKSLLTQLKTGFNQWRLIFLVFALTYALLVSLDLMKTPIQWDEIANLNDGMFLLRGEYRSMNLFYPPLFDVAAMIFFKVLGVSILSGRLISVLFSLLSLWVLFELANNLYGWKTALVSSILLGIMPGYIWLSRLALIETMLVFFFILSMFFFFKWLRKNQDKMLVLSGLALGLGFLAKYQMLIAGVIMILSILFLARDHLRLRLSKFAQLIVIAVAVVTPWILISYQTYTSKTLNQWIYALQMGNPEKSLYSMRFPLPVFYFIEMTWPYSDIHPISPFLYALSLLGLGLFAWRRKTEDKFVLIWFLVVFVFFTLISNKQWRYVVPLFPTLAFSASSFILFALNKFRGMWEAQLSANKKRGAKVVAALFIVFLALGVIFSVNDSNYWIVKEQAQIDIEGATHYAANRLRQNESIMLLCPFNLFSRDMVKFYLYANENKNNDVWQYPPLPVDTYTPNFNITKLISLCKGRNVKYVFTYEFGGTVPYFNTTLNLQKIYAMLYDSGNFTHISDEATFGSNPRRIFVLTFLG